MGEGRLDSSGSGKGQAEGRCETSDSNKCEELLWVVEKQGFKKSRMTFCKLAPNVGRSSVWNVLLVAFLAHRFLTRSLDL
jgi:hypothetical protein